MKIFGPQQIGKHPVLHVHSILCYYEGHERRESQTVGQERRREGEKEC